MPPPDRPTTRAQAVGVAIADPHPLYRDALSRTVSAHPALSLVGSADSLDALRPVAPDVLVLDTALLASDVAGRWDTVPRLLLVTEEIDGGELYAALEAGASGYVSKESTGEALCQAILGVARGKTVLDPDAQAAMAGEIRLRTHDERPLLSPREHEILGFIAQGETAPQIARRLHLSTATVKTHQLHAYSKLGVTERAAAVAVAMRWGLIE